MNNIQRINPAGLFDSRSSGFSQVCVKETAIGKVITVSGQVAWDENRTIQNYDLESQAITSLQNIKKALAAADATLADIMSLRIYIVESEIKNSAAITNALVQVFGDNLPTTTWIGVPALASKDFLVEIEPDQIIISH